MEKYIINGGKPLYGNVSVSGAKNAALAIVSAAVLVDGTCVIENIPKIRDVAVHLNILRRLGASVKLINDKTVEINCSGIRTTNALFNDLTRKTRASYYFVGSLLGRFGAAHVSLSGGCNFGGVRPIDQHIKGFEQLGAKVDVRSGIFHAECPDGLIGSSVFFDISSVGATMNIMLAAVKAKGMTYLENAAKEPHIVDLANFLNTMGADIKGAGTDIIKIRGVSKLRSGFYSIIPDQIEAGTYMAAVSACGGEIIINDVITKHLDCISAKLAEMGVEVEDLGDAVRVRRTGELSRTNITILPYPGYPTDMNPQTAVLLCLANGTSVMTETVWPSRFKYMDELKRMGAIVQVDGSSAVIEGVKALSGAPVEACDLRAGSALVIAGMAATGVTEISGIEHIERGYENLIPKLRSLGADIVTVNVADNDEASLGASV
ncbi:MAG: UDP-N-acetylglucosamine 1-carboxyvinyltransferase [Clostridiales bacterium]|nr:UDP-N-acetylglucosamine 1-carboxyvinyltransferase [Clostridiales bacterium]